MDEDNPSPLVPDVSSKGRDVADELTPPERLSVRGRLGGPRRNRRLGRGVAEALLPESAHGSASPQGELGRPHDHELQVAKLATQPERRLVLLARPWGRSKRGGDSRPRRQATNWIRLSQPPMNWLRVFTVGPKVSNSSGRMPSVS